VDVVVTQGKLAGDDIAPGILWVFHRCTFPSPAIFMLPNLCGISVLFFIPKTEMCNGLTWLSVCKLAFKFHGSGPKPLFLAHSKNLQYTKLN